MKKILVFCLFMVIPYLVFSQQTRPKISQMELAPGEFYTIVTDAGGVQTYELIQNDVIDSFYITAQDSLCISVSDSWSGDPIGTFCVPFFDPDITMMVDTIFQDASGSTIETNLNIPLVDSYWEVFRNGIRLNTPGDWILDGSEVQFSIPLDDDLIVIRHPEE